MTKLLRVALGVLFSVSAVGCYVQERHGPEYESRCHGDFHWDGWDCHRDGEPAHDHRR
jgi:hypothetical protein